MEASYLIECIMTGKQDIQSTYCDEKKETGRSSDDFESLIVKVRLSRSTRGIWKVLSMVFYLSNRFTKPIMFVNILKSHSFSMLWHKFHEDIITQTRKFLL